MGVARRGLSVLFMLSALWGACGDDDKGDGHDDHNGHGADHEGLVKCCQIGAICHDGDKPGGDPTIGECHDLGHENDPDVCIANFDRCVSACVPAGQEPNFPDRCNDPSANPH